MRLSNPDLSTVQPILNRSLFAINDLPLSHYVDPDAARLGAYKCIKLERYEQLTPRTFQVAQALFGSLGNRNRWAENVRGRNSGQAQWAIHTRDAAGTHGNRNYPQRGLQLIDVLRALTRQTRYAIGCFDGYVDTSALPYACGVPYRWPTHVSMLLIDVDMDAAWEKQNLEAVRHQVAMEEAVLTFLHLSCSWLKTGGRGHQLVIPLPCSVPRSAASVLALAIKRLLSELTVEDAIVDATNLDHVMRLAGGRHARTNDLALFFDPRTCLVFEVDHQLELLASAYRPVASPLPGIWDTALFADSMEEIASHCEASLEVALNHPIHSTPSYFDGALRIIAERLDANPILMCLNDAYLHFLEESLLQEKNSETNTSVMPADEEQVTKSKPLLASQEHALRAKEIWECGFAPGGSWKWLTQGDGTWGNGVWAAFFLFGDQACERLLEKSLSIGAHSATELAKREQTIQELCKNHKEGKPANSKSTKLGDLVSIVGALSAPPTKDQSEFVETLLEEIIAARAIRETGRKAKLQQRTIVHLGQIIHVLLHLLEKDSRREISRRSLHEAIITKFGEDSKSLSFKTVDNLLALISAGEAECLVPIFEEIRPIVKGRNRGLVRDARPRNFPTKFQPGPRLHNDPLYIVTVV